MSTGISLERLEEIKSNLEKRVDANTRVLIEIHNITTEQERNGLMSSNIVGRGKLQQVDELIDEVKKSSGQKRQTVAFE